MPLNAVPFSFGDNWTVIDDDIIMNSLMAAYGKDISHVSPHPQPPSLDQVSGQEVQCNPNFSHFILQYTTVLHNKFSLLKKGIQNRSYKGQI
jgi:hypothetical protein